MTFNLKAKDNFPRAQSQKLEIIQLLRALAVLCVVISHIAHELSAMLFGKVANFNAKLFPGDFGVDLFFVISGFIMVYTCWDSFQRENAAPDFMRRRIIRIVPLYWLATSLMILAIILFPHKINTATSDWYQWISSYLFFPYARESDGLVRPVLGLGWSLQYEMLFYALFALSLYLPRKAGMIALIVALVIITAGTNLLVPDAYVSTGVAQFLSHPIILEFGAGVFLGYLYCSGFRFSGTVGVVALVCGILLLLFVPSFNDVIDRWRLFHYGLPATIFVSACIFIHGIDEVSVPRPVLNIGESSYSIYLCHPFVIGIVSLIFARFDLVAELDPLNLLFTFSVSVLLVSILVGHFVHFLFDLPFTNFLRRSSFLRTRSEKAAVKA